MKTRMVIISLFLIPLILGGCTKSEEIIEQIEPELYILEAKQDLDSRSADISYGEAFNIFLSDPEWSYTLDYSGDFEKMHVVTVKGYCTYDGEKTRVSVDFIRMASEEKFEPTYIEMNGFNYNYSFLSDLLDAVFEKAAGNEKNENVNVPSEDTKDDNSVEESQTENINMPLTASAYFIKNYDSLWSFETLEEFLAYKYGALGSTAVYRIEDPEYGVCVNPNIYLNYEVNWSEEDYDTILWDILYATAVIEYGVEQVYWGYGYVCGNITKLNGAVYYMDNNDCTLYIAQGD